jgi:protein SCO1/2
MKSWGDTDKGSLPSYANVQAAPAKDGRYLFTRHCAACHTIGHGDKIGPDLIGVTSVREHQWLVKQIATPERILAEKDPIATALFKKYKKVQMPNLRLEDDEVEMLIDFLKEQTDGPQPASAHKPVDQDFLGNRPSH